MHFSKFNFLLKNSNFSTAFESLNFYDFFQEFEFFRFSPKIRNFTNFFELNLFLVGRTETHSKATAKMGNLTGMGSTDQSLLPKDNNFTSELLKTESSTGMESCRRAKNAIWECGSTI